MKKALFFTAYNRVAYLQQVLHSWYSVRGLEDWHIVALIEPSPVQNQIREEFELFKESLGLTNMEIIVNPERYGVLHHPWVGFQKLLVDEHFDFAVRAEDDLVVSDDVLEYFTWAAKEFRGDAQVVTVNAFSSAFVGTPDEVVRGSKFSPWVWGTWANRWKALVGPTWDHDYSTFNEESGNQSGWDWNLDTRVIPAMNLRTISPILSRSDNIGVYGVHGTPANFVSAVGFRYRRPEAAFRTVDSKEHD